ncbi:hypothetical protein QUF74_13755 [Candidatus Halobeggiatoa sp. HSG11]|nr:hypothetical protein [Candidatus Halobeggiatoa sp. HSG11]
MSTQPSFQALKLIENYKFSFYDALIINAALNSKCHILLSEDMQHGQLIENNLQIVNPFFNVIGYI